MWKAILSFWLCWGLAGFSLAETTASKATKTNLRCSLWTGGNLACSSESDAVSKIDAICKQWWSGSFARATLRTASKVDIECQTTGGTLATSYFLWDNGTPTCPDSSWTLSPDKTTCSRPDVPADQMNQVCSNISKTSSQTFTDQGCQPTSGLPSGYGCEVYYNFIHNSVTGQATGSYRYGPNACKVCNATNMNDCYGFPQMNPAEATTDPVSPYVTQDAVDPQQCAASGGTMGEVNGKTTCVGNAPKPGENTMQTTSDGKDSGGNCAQGYVGVIDKNNNFVCKQPANPNSGADIVRSLDGGTCPQGYDKVGSYCYSNGKPKATTGGTGGTGDASSPTSTNPGGGGSPTNPNDNKKDEEKAEDCKSAFGGVFSAFCPDQNTPPELDLTAPNLGKSDSINVGSLLNTSDRLIGSGSCPQPKQVQITLGSASKTLEFTYQPFCTVAGYIRPFLIGLSFISAAFIILRRG